MQQARVNGDGGRADGRRGRPSQAVRRVQRMRERRMASAGLRRHARLPPRVSGRGQSREA